jgi:hypothetical protein
MKKIALLVLAGVLVMVMPVAAEKVYTSEGYYEAEIRYVGKYWGQASANTISSTLSEDFTTVRSGDNVKLSKGQWDCIKQLLNRYDTGKGDTFLIVFSHSQPLDDMYCVVCEYTSNTQYNYWISYGSRKK